jgi:hypothetical protein
MGLREDLARDGNGKSIMRMHNEGMGKNQISGVFKDNGIPAVTSKVVQGVIDSHDALATRALPKKVERAAIKAYLASKNPGGVDGLAAA